MPRNKAFLIVMSILLCFTGLSAAQQLWSGVLSPARATNWTNAGVVGGIPSGSWTQCGSTIGAYSGSATAINNAITACGTNQYVLLGPGTFSLTSGIDFGRKSNVVLRGSGASSTFVLFGSGASVNCNGQGTLICVQNRGGEYWVPGTGINWTAGYTQGSTQVTLSNTSGITSNSVLVLNQCDDGYSGVNCAGTAVDNGGYFNCSDVYAGGTNGCSVNGPDSGNGTTHRFQAELFQVASVNAATGVVTLASPLKHPNWTSARTPQAWFFTPVQYSGVENLSIDSSANKTDSAILFMNALNVWVRGVRVVDPNTSAFRFLDSLHFQAEQNYLYQAQSVDPFGIRLTVVCDGLIQNNIIQQIRAPILDEGDDCGTVIAYNYTIENYYNSDAMFESFRPHSNGDDYELYEGNIAANYYGEDYHGTHLMQTIYRNYFTGWESYNPAKDYQTNALMLDAYNRYHNVVGNVLGTPGYHTDYQATALGDSRAVYVIGAGNGAVSPAVPNDPIALSTMFRWGNYDVVTGAARFCGNSSDSGWSTTCGSASEVPSGISVYPNSVPTVGDTAAGQPALPPSFYLASKPSWWGTMPWPAIGPDVTGGNLGQCSGGTFNKVAALSTAHCGGSALVGALNGHVNANPAMACYLNVMGGPPDGSGSALPFDANTCYGGSSSGSGTNAPPPPTNLTGTVQ